jgi:hypothetical protein
LSADLVVLVADKDIEYALRGLLRRPEALGIRRIATDFISHPQHDPGVFTTGHEVLRAYVRDYGHALVVLDAAWSGAPSSASHVEQHIAARLWPMWGDKAGVVCIDPEVEIWVWSNSPHVATILGWQGIDQLRAWLLEQGFIEEGRIKPTDPKSAYLAALRAKRVSRSASNFEALGAKVSVERCTDAAFVRLCTLLRAWFPQNRE